MFGFLVGGIVSLFAPGPLDAGPSLAEDLQTLVTEGDLPAEELPDLPDAVKERLGRTASKR